ncbi:DsbA family protein [Algihabitans albus]|uniref:DsbA family protein n=1 Tax=Algihabitans albus TaxID=2164067 RepID=UPI001ABC5797|nr:DsbA family protein [Algihabitans albus]
MAKAGSLVAGAVLAAMLLLPGGAVQAQDATLSDAEQAAVRALVRQTLMENPEILIEALQLYEQQQLQAEVERQGQALAAHRTALENDPTAPVIGNPDGDVVVVEFFDYNCPYCRRVAEPLRQAIEADGNLKVVMKEWPILGPESYFASRAALAAQEQGRYEDFHFALMERAGKLTQDQVLAIAEDLGLDMAQLQADMRSPDIDAALQRTYDLAEALGINGTPAFVVGEEILPGAVTMSRLQQAVAQAREGS